MVGPAPIDEARLHSLGLIAYVPPDGSEVTVRLAGKHPLYVAMSAARVVDGWIPATRRDPPKTGRDARLPFVGNAIGKQVIDDDPEALVAMGVVVHPTCVDALGGWDDLTDFAAMMRDGFDALARDEAERGW
ncbi:hypothetical protein Sa4125_29890 [Aureimonas sp. SA4125]|uniref:hypothetical protein n=1 Tax=Aureimonas sp. SA4125 TaxID=2826993 RepID=UPI001CC49F97|nr:hypothetical protein [Aureimonas sp. SA4125]BDA85447.1 hypothetical protein Sa4125_29890 [Aureimonas sp. SA4125]